TSSSRDAKYRAASAVRRGGRTERLAHGGGDEGDLLGGEARRHGQAQHAIASGFRVRKGSLRIAERGIRRLKVQRLRIVDGRLDIAGGKLRGQRVAIACVDSELVIDALVARIVGGNMHA